MAFLLPFDIENIMVNQWAGGLTIFILIGLVYLASWGARYRMGSGVFGLMLASFTIYLSSYTPFFVVTLIAIAFALAIGVKVVIER